MCQPERSTGAISETPKAHCQHAELACDEGEGEDGILRDQRFGRIQELRKERGEEQDGLGIAGPHQQTPDKVRTQALAGARRGVLDIDGFSVVAERLDAEPDEVEGPDHLDHGEGELRCRQQSTEAQSVMTPRTALILPLAAASAPDLPWFSAVVMHISMVAPGDSTSTATAARYSK